MALDLFQSIVSGAIASTDTLVQAGGYVEGVYINVPLDGGTGTGAIATVTVDALGDVIQVQPTSEGTGYTVGDVLTVDGTDIGGVDPTTVTVASVQDVVVAGVTDPTEYFNHDLYEDGGPVSEITEPPLLEERSSYTPKGEFNDFGGAAIYPYAGVSGYSDDNIPVTETVRLADMPQMTVQKRDIDGGTITVFAEPNIVNGYGERVGYTIRAEDLTDQERCEAYRDVNGNQIFVWNTTTPEVGNRGTYGYCSPIAAGDITYATSDADCPSGYKWDGVTGCIVMTAAEVNALVDNVEVKMRACEAIGLHWSKFTDECIDALADPSLLSIVNFDFGTKPNQETQASSKNDYLATACRALGLNWNKNLGECSAPVVDLVTINAEIDPAVRRDMCLANGNIWIAGLCYGANEFGDGHNRLDTVTAKGKVNPV